MRWETIILLVMLAYPLTQTAEVHGVTISDYITEENITFAISAYGAIRAINATSGEVFNDESFNVSLSVTGAWWGFYGNLIYGEDRITFGSIDDPILDGARYPKSEWSYPRTISGLQLGWYHFTFEAYYWPDPDYHSYSYSLIPPTGPVTVSVSVHVVPQPTQKPTLNLIWLTPLSKHNSSEAGRTIPIRFSIHNNTDFKPDRSVNVTVKGPDRYVFSATYGTRRDDVRIRESAEYYIVYWKTPRTPGLYKISVGFEEFSVDPSSLSISLR